MNVVALKETDKSNRIFDASLLDGLGVPVKNLVSDSRRIKPGDTFLAYAGYQYDAREFIPQAIAAGANAVLWEQHDFCWNPTWQLPALPISELKIKSGFIASHVYGNPSQKMQVIGITGTNGKTSCCHWIAQALTVLNKKAMVVGTLGNGFVGKLDVTANTTPEAILMQQEMAKYLRQGADSVAVEVSSHGIAQGRLNGSTISVAVLTNLSRDHLDYHASMDEYAAIKAQLFFWPGLKHAVLNLDDMFGVKLSQQLMNRNTQVFAYGFKVPALELEYLNSFKIIHGLNLVATVKGLTFDVMFEDYCAQITVDLIGRFNASNILSVLATLLASGVKFSDAVMAVQQIQPIVGRMEKFGGGALPAVIVDYAHTPDALEKVLVTLREVAPRKAELFCVLGCGGNRDSGKRRLMGEVATRLADKVILTSDNPRDESPRMIIEEIAADAHSGFSIEEDRALAIRQAIHSAGREDIVLIAGKGHETYQEIGQQKLPFSDRNVVMQVLRELAPKIAS